MPSTTVLDAVKQALLADAAVNGATGGRVYREGEEPRLKSRPWVLVRLEETTRSYSPARPYFEASHVRSQSFGRGHDAAEALAGLVSAALSDYPLTVAGIASLALQLGAYRVESLGKKADGLPLVRADVTHAVGFWRGLVHLLTLERPAYTLSAAGVRVPAWSVVYADEPCRLYLPTEREVEERGLVGPATRAEIYLGRELTVTTEDRAKVGGVYYEVRGYRRSTDPLDPPVIEAELVP